MPSMLIQFLRALLREAVLRKTMMVVAFSVVSLLVLAVGLFMPRTFESQATLFADERNVIKPLLEGRAAVTEIDRAQEAKNMLQTRRVLELIARQAGLIKGSETPDKQELALTGLRDKLKIEGQQSSNRGGSNFISLSYADSDPGRTFRVMSAVVDVFIRDSGDSKRRESKSAYEFIDGQVKTYKEQLMQAEERLKQFNTENQDGSAEASSTRISQLLAEIETMKLDIADAKTRREVLQQQLSREGPYVSQRLRADAQQEAIASAQRQLEALRATYTDTHPDVIRLRQQIDDMRRDANARGGGVSAGQAAAEPAANPVYAELRTRQADVESEIRSKELRVQSTETLLAQERERAKRIAARQAELSELTRDYTVTKGIYEDLLERKERARISMTLDVEGQGVTYRLQETPTYPTAPKGLQFIHFVLAGPLLGILVPIAALLAFIQLDPRVRFPQPLEAHSGVPVIAVVPHMTTPFAKRMLRSDMLVLSVAAVVVIVLYVIIAACRLLGVI